LLILKLNLAPSVIYNDTKSLAVVRVADSTAKG